MTLSPAFPCNQCGACCRQVHRAAETRYLDRGDGACMYYEDLSKQCKIYEHRPLICQVEKQFLMNYEDKYSWPEFIEMNQIACRVLETL